MEQDRQEDSDTEKPGRHGKGKRMVRGLRLAYGYYPRARRSFASSPAGKAAQDDTRRGGPLRLVCPYRGAVR
jgi:hypothetical protein